MFFPAPETQLTVVMSWKVYILLAIEGNIVLACFFWRTLCSWLSEAFQLTGTFFGKAHSRQSPSRAGKSCSNLSRGVSLMQWVMSMLNYFPPVLLVITLLHSSIRSSINYFSVSSSSGSLEMYSLQVCFLQPYPAPRFFFAFVLYYMSEFLVR